MLKSGLANFVGQDMIECDWFLNLIQEEVEQVENMEKARGGCKE